MKKKEHEYIKRIIEKKKLQNTIHYKLIFRAIKNRLLVI